MTSWDARVYFVLQLERRLGELYAWGGDGEDEFGLDCSGLICDCLTETSRVAPGLYDGQRRSAQGLLAYYRKHGLKTRDTPVHLKPGELVFFRHSRTGKIFHVQAHCYYFDVIKYKDALGSEEKQMWHGPRGVHSTSRGYNASTLDEPGDALARGAGVFPCQTGTHGSNRDITIVDPFMVLT